MRPADGSSCCEVEILEDGEHGMLQRMAELDVVYHCLLQTGLFEPPSISGQSSIVTALRNVSILILTIRYSRFAVINGQMEA